MPAGASPADLVDDGRVESGSGRVDSVRPTRDWIAAADGGRDAKPRRLPRLEAGAADVVT
jgi:hypothetical protein